MKMIYCSCDISMLEVLLLKLDEVGAPEYQVIDHVTVKNRRGEPRFNTAVWPGYNAIVMVPSENELATKIIKEIASMNLSVVNENELITTMSWSLDQNPDPAIHK
jgi:hypothetical protein